jgi:hypothetical protein
MVLSCAGASSSPMASAAPLCGRAWPTRQTAIAGSCRQTHWQAWPTAAWSVLGGVFFHLGIVERMSKDAAGNTL